MTDKIDRTPTPVEPVALQRTTVAPGRSSSTPPARNSGASFRALSGAPTPVDPHHASSLLAGAYREVTGREPSSSTLGLLWAQWALETARGQAMFGNNFAGIKSSGAGPSALLSTTEGFGRHAHRTHDRFRTYGTPEAGARDYVALLRHRFPGAFSALETGDTHAFARELQRGRYFTGDPVTYLQGLARLSEEHATGVASAQPSGKMGGFLDGVRWALERKRDFGEDF